MTAVSQAFDTSEREITVTYCEKLRGGRSAGGRGWVIYLVRALEADLAPIDVELRSFAALEPGPQRVTFELYQDAKGYTTYTLKRAQTDAERIREKRMTARDALNIPRADEPAAAPAPADDARLAAVEARLDQLDARLDLILSIVQGA